jgi:uncharacterized MAPEG superfamily protein
VINLEDSRILLYCVAAGVVLIYLPFSLVGYGRISVGYDMGAPRAMFDKLPDYAKRATWAHENTFEAFTIFAPAALMAYVTGQNSSLAIGAALTFVVVRLLYSIFYIVNIPLARSLMFAIGALCSGTLYVLSILSANNPV